MDGRVALVTGASRGIGRAIARGLSADGAYVICNFVRGEAGAQETVRQIQEQGGAAETLGFDVADSEGAAKTIAAAAKRLGRLDVLVNNAGISLDGLVLRLDETQWDETMATNLRGVFNCTKAAARTMLRARHGRIINIGSIIGEMGNAGQAAYAASKAGIIGFTKSVARELAGRDITANVVAPGFIDTDMVEGLPEEVRAEYLKRIPAGRLGTAEEVADLVAFLARPETAYITGQVIGVNGGLYM